MNEKKTGGHLWYIEFHRLSFTMRHLTWLLIPLTLGISSVVAIPRSQLYQYGPDIDDVLTRTQESSSSKITLRVPIVFYSEEYDAIYVNANGLLSFLSDIPSFLNIQFPLDYPVLAPLYADVDLRGSGNVFFRESQDPGLLERATENIRVAFKCGQDFAATSLFIATWNNVGYYKLGSDKVNSFQVVIANNGTDSYAEYIYPEGGIQWIQGTGQDPRLPDARAQVGMVAGDGRFYTLHSSGTDQVQYMDRSSNVGKRGVWMFHIGQINNDGNVMPPDLAPQDPDIEESTCASLGSTTCHSKALCTDYDIGFCCHCTEDYYGNGINCIAKDTPLRVSGKLSGHLNDVELNELDIQSYVVTSDGRTYTAISRVPESVGYDMQLLHVIGGVIGWLFARPVNKAVNGYQLTGGVFNHTSQLVFPQSGHSMTVRQKYYGPDVFNQLKMKVEIQGTLPAIPHGVKVDISEYEEQYTRSSSGKIVSRMNQFFKLEGVPVQNPFEVEHTLQYTECDYSPLNFTSLNMKVTRNLVVYEAHEKIVRYGMTSKILPPEDHDPCEEGHKTCVENSSCVPDGDTFTCVCHPGYQYLLLSNFSDNAAACVDVNECTSGVHNCHLNADCINLEGSYSCQCKTGYVGEGYQCVAENCVVANNCSPFATCQYDEAMGEYVCSCLPGYNGDGFSCFESDTLAANCNTTDCWCPYDFELEGLICLKKQIVESPPDAPRPATSCSEKGICHTQISCLYDDVTGNESCHCNPGYRMEGNTCVSEDECQDDSDCISNAVCNWSHQFNHYQCMCKEEFYLLNGECRPVTKPPDAFCKRECHPNALCTYKPETHTHECSCNPGYVGNGYYCEEDAPSCNILNNCEAGAECVYDQSARGFRCKCRQNYQSNGTHCVPKISCYEHPELCGPDSTCILNSHGQYRCQCNEGFVGNGITCTVISHDKGDNFLLLTQGMGVLKIMPERSESRPIMMKPFQEAVGIDVDCFKSRVYWSDIAGKSIKSAFYNGSGVDTFMSSELGSLEGISIDWISRNIYWTDSDKDTIEVANLDHKGRKVLISNGLVNPRGIAVHPEIGKMFWSDWNREAPKLESANLDGTARKIFLQGDFVSLPNSLAIDWANNELCWTDAGIHAIGCIGINHPTPRIVVKGINYPFGLAVTAVNYYWTDWKTQKVESAQKISGHRNEAIVTPLRTTGKLYGIVAVQGECPRLTNICEFENGLCGNDRLCLPNGIMERTCACGEFNEEGSGDEVLCNEII